MEENQTFTTFDSVSVWTLMVGVLFLVASIVSNATTDQRHGRASTQAELLAYQLVAGEFKSLTNSNLSESTEKGGRGLASKTENFEILAEGNLGLDPWGKPYHYKIMPDVKGRDVAIVISAGPNQKRETGQDEVIATSTGAFEQLKVEGDDIAFVARTIIKK